MLAGFAQFIRWRAANTIQHGIYAGSSTLIWSYLVSVDMKVVTMQKLHAHT